MNKVVETKNDNQSKNELLEWYKKYYFSEAYIYHDTDSMKGGYNCSIGGGLLQHYINFVDNIFLTEKLLLETLKTNIDQYNKINELLLFLLSKEQDTIYTFEDKFKYSQNLFSEKEKHKKNVINIVNSSILNLTSYIEGYIYFCFEETCRLGIITENEIIKLRPKWFNKYHGIEGITYQGIAQQINFYYKVYDNLYKLSDFIDTSILDEFRERRNSICHFSGKVSSKYIEKYPNKFLVGDHFPYCSDYFDTIINGICIIGFSLFILTFFEIHKSKSKKELLHSKQHLYFIDLMPVLLKNNKYKIANKIYKIEKKIDPTIENKLFENYLKYKISGKISLRTIKEFAPIHRLCFSQNQKEEILKLLNEQGIEGFNDIHDTSFDNLIIRDYLYHS